MRVALLLLLSFVLSGAMVVAAIAQDLESRPPSVIKLGKFVVPKSARNLEGPISVIVSVDEAGRPTAVDGVVGPGPVCPDVTRAEVLAVRAAARDAALKTTFEPARLNGQAVASTATIEFALPMKKKQQEGSEEPTNYTAAGAPPIAVGGSQTLAGGGLEGKATGLPKPAYPPAARAVRASGSVHVRVLIDEDGTVFSAYAVSGHPLLRAGSVRSACQARFQPTLLSGEPVKVTGIITYNFVP